MSEHDLVYGAAVHLAIPFVEKALHTDGKVPAGELAKIAEQAVELANAIHYATGKALAR